MTNAASAQDLFYPLQRRLYSLKDYRQHYSFPDKDYGLVSLDDLELKALKYEPAEILEEIEFCLTEIKLLQEAGEKIVQLVTVNKSSNMGDDPPDLNNDPVFVDASQKEIKAQKKVVYKQLSQELLYYDSKLNSLKEHLQDRLKFAESFHPAAVNVVINIDDNYKISELRKINETSLDRYQTALLFYYLKTFNVIQKDISDLGLAKLLAAMTGFSIKNLTSYFSYIEEVKKDGYKYVNKGNKEKSKEKYYNLTSVKDTLRQIIDEVDNKMSHLEKPASTKKSSPL